MGIVVRASAVYLLIFLVTRFSGRRTLSEMSSSELILLVVMGDLIQQGVTGEDFSLVGAVLAVFTITFWVAVLNFLSFRSRRLQNALSGVPVVILHNGEVLLDALKLEGIPLSDLLEAARNKGIDDLARVRLAVIEPDGQFSFIERDKAAGSGSGDDPAGGHQAHKGT